MLIHEVTYDLVSCSAGVGRTGTYIGLDALWKEGFKTGYVDILSFARKMRKNRTKMIQTLVNGILDFSRIFKVLEGFFSHKYMVVQQFPCIYNGDI